MASLPTSVSRPIPKPSRRNQIRHPRLQTPDRSPSPAGFYTNTPPPQWPQRQCPAADCRSFNIVEDGLGSWVCNECGQIVSEGEPYVSDQQWTETAAGASQPQGTYVASGQTHSRTIQTLPGGQRVGGAQDGADNGAKTKKAALEAIRNYATNFGIAETVIQQATGIFSLALMAGFLSGRTLESVSAVCLYTACRRVRDTDSRAATLMLIDLAEVTDMNVFLLGSIYTKMVHRLELRKSTDRNERVEPMPPETLVSRFAHELEFGRDTGIIKRDAVNIVKRMNRDWMTTGRRQAGICGAAIILAARMNNYRRTVREVVLVAKVTEFTISKRLEEFQFTESSNLTVDAFKNGVIRDALTETDPPAYYRAMGKGPQKKRKKKRKRGKGTEDSGDTATELEEEEEEDSDDPTIAKQVRLDEQGFKIPPLPNRATPIDPQLQPEPSTSQEQPQPELPPPPNRVTVATAASTRPRRQGRPAGAKNWKPPPPSSSELALERDIEQDLQYVLDHNDTPTAASAAESSSRRSDVATRTITLSSDDEVRANDPTAPVIAAWQSTPETLRPAVDSNVGNTGSISLSPTIKPTEFDDDPEVSICLLTDAESAVKERIWVDENAEWLRKDSMKRVKRELKEKERRDKGVGEEPDKPGGKSGRRKKPPRRGDGTPYRDLGRTDGEVDGDAVLLPNGERRRERSSSEAIKRMLDLRAPNLSRRLRVNVFDKLFGEGDGSEEGSRSGSRSHSRSRSASIASGVAPGTSAVRQHGHGAIALGASAAATAAESVSQRIVSASASTSPMPTAGNEPEQPAASLDSASRTASSLRSPIVVTPALPTSRKQRQQETQNTGSPAPTNPAPPATVEEDEVLGSVNDSELSSLTSSANSPIIGVTAHGFGGADGDEAEDDESDGDDDDYVDDDVDAAFEGRSSRRPVLRLDDEDDEDVDMDDD